MVAERLLDTVATIRLTGEEIEYNQVPVEILVQTLSGLQTLVYLLAAKEDKIFKIDKNLRKKYTLRCQIPKSGSYAIPIALSAFPNSKLSHEPSLVMDNLERFLQSLQETDFTYVQKIFPEHKIMAKALQEVQKFLPKNENRWQFRFYRMNRFEVVLTNNTYQQIKNWLTEQSQTTTSWMTMAGKIISIDFEHKSFILKDCASQRRVKCTYREQRLEEIIIENKRKSVQITGIYYFDPNDNLLKIENVERIEIQDLSPIHLKEISWKSKKLILKHPLVLEPFWDDTQQLLIVEKPLINLYAYAYTREQLLEEINEQILFMWHEYVKSDESKLAPDAIKLKKELIKFFQET